MIPLLIFFIVMVVTLGSVMIILSSAQNSRRRRLGSILLGGLSTLFLCVCMILLPLLTSPFAGYLVTWPFSDVLQGEWTCVNANPNCAPGVDVGDITLVPGPTILFTKYDRLATGSRSTLWRSGTLTTNNLTCEYGILNKSQVRVDCGFGILVLDYQQQGDSLTIGSGENQAVYRRGP
jgi:hypothetical protein